MAGKRILEPINAADDADGGGMDCADQCRDHFRNQEWPNAWNFKRSSFWKEKRKMIKKTMHKLKNIVYRNTGEWVKGLPITEK